VGSFGRLVVVAILRLTGGGHDRVLGARLDVLFQQHTQDQQRGSGYERDRHDRGHPAPSGTNGRRR